MIHAFCLRVLSEKRREREVFKFFVLFYHTGFILRDGEKVPAITITIKALSFSYRYFVLLVLQIAHNLLDYGEARQSRTDKFLKRTGLNKD